MTIDLSTTAPFHFTPTCGAPGCEAPAAYKVAAAWYEGSFRELKTYALACLDHAEALKAEAEARRANLILAENESLDPIGIYDLTSSQRDSARRRVDD